MAGQIKLIIDKIVNEKSKGNAIIANSIRTKIILKGIMVGNYDTKSTDDPKVINSLRGIAKEFGVNL